MAEPMTLDLKTLTAEIVGAHVANNSVAAGDLPKLIKTVHDALAGLGQAPAPAAPGAQKPAVSIRSSVKPDYIVCLEDGAKLKMLKRYLRTRYNMTPDEYRQKWSLPKDYPMVAPNYSDARKALALAIGMGGRSVEKVEEATTIVTKSVRKRIRKTAGEMKEILGDDQEAVPLEATNVAAEPGEATTTDDPSPKPRRKLKLKTG